MRNAPRPDQTLALLAATLLFACGGGSGGPTSPPPPPPPPPTPVASVSLDPSAAIIAPNQTLQLTATPRDAGGNALSGRAVTWTSSATGIATVTTSGLVTAVTAGLATISAASEGATGSAQITVRAPVETVVVTPPTAALLVGATVRLAAAPKDVAGNALSDRTVTWTSDNPNVATVDQTGLVVALTPGTVNVSASSEGKTGTAQIAVTAPVASVAVSPPQAQLVVGLTVQLVATARDAAGNPLSGRPITWASSNPAVATVSASGLVSAIGAGVAAITATSEGKSGAAALTVIAPLASVVVTGKFTTKVGDTYHYDFEARLADGTLVSRPGTWSVVETARAAMSSDGTLVPLQSGAITLVVTIDGTAWTAPSTAYDWLDLSSGGAVRVALQSDVVIANKFGTTERPLLVLSCTSGGIFFVYVSFQHFVTANGLVAYSFNGGTIFTQTWDEISSFDALFHPGPTNVERRGFGLVMAAANYFGFAFTEFNASARAMIFRVTGLDSRIGALVSACPSNAVVMAGPDLARDRVTVETLLGRGPIAMTADQIQRAAAGPQMTPAPSPLLRLTAPDSKPAARRLSHEVARPGAASRP